MSVSNRLHNLEDQPDPVPTFSDDEVLAALKKGVVDDRHVDWLDALMRPEIQLNLCYFGLALRAIDNEATRQVRSLDAPVCVGARVLARRADEPIPDELERLISSVFKLSIQDPYIARKLFDQPCGREAAACDWVRYRLVMKALSGDLGQSLRATLDQVETNLGRIPEHFDLRSPHPVIRKRIDRFASALHQCQDLPLVINEELRSEIAAFPTNTRIRRDWMSGGGD